VLQWAAGCCRVLQCVAVCCSVQGHDARSDVDGVAQWVAVCGSVLQCVAACSSVLQCVAVCDNVLQCAITRLDVHGMLQ